MTAGLPEAIEALDAHHDRRSFSCGDSELDGYLKRFARQHAAAKVSRTYVAANGATITPPSTSPAMPAICAAVGRKSQKAQG